ncbi:alpha/beta hydrolase [Dactylosporangium sp. NPDC050688]|uniref:alpha/beta hydrolase n=1 Tax=Dactylosporangium sp. NPDC050688 TaxID=3157217 RepID=UPI0033E17EDF
MSTNPPAGPRHRRATVVLVHDAFADPASWASVTAELGASDIAVLAPANPLRGLDSDAPHLSGIVQGIGGPVVLVGHGYGGAVVTEAASGVDNVTALGFVAGLGLDAGESWLDIAARFPDVPQATVGDTAIRLDRRVFAEVYAADLAHAAADTLAVRQRPASRAVLTGAVRQPGWRQLPCWYAIATADRVVHPIAQRFMAMRMAAVEIEIDASHAVVLSQPAAIAQMIMEALR